MQKVEQARLVFPNEDELVVWDREAARSQIHHYFSKNMPHFGGRTISRITNLCISAARTGVFDSAQGK